MSTHQDTSPPFLTLFYVQARETTAFPQSWLYRTHLDLDEDMLVITYMRHHVTVRGAKLAALQREITSGAISELRCANPLLPSLPQYARVVDSITITKRDDEDE